MTEERSTLGLVSLVVAVLSLGGALYPAVRWIAVWDSHQPRDAVLANFMAGFPGWLSSPQAVTWASLAACAVAVGAALLAHGSLQRSLRRLGNVVLVLAALLGVWNLFTLM
jgi:hypothetical protein